MLQCIILYRFIFTYFIYIIVNKYLEVEIIKLKTWTIS